MTSQDPLAIQAVDQGRRAMNSMQLRWVGVVCLVVGPAAMVAQGLVSPVTGGTEPAVQVADARQHLSAMRLALVLDVPLVLVIPAVIFVGAHAGLGRSRLASIGTGLAFLSMLAAMLILANDALLYEAGRLGGEEATALVEAYQANGLFLAMLVAYLLGQPLGFILLGAALWRGRQVHRIAAAMLACGPLVQFAGVLGDSEPVATAGSLLYLVSFAAVAVAMVRTEGSAEDRASTGTLASLPAGR